MRVCMHERGGGGGGGGGGGKGRRRKRRKGCLPPKVTILLSLDAGTALSRALAVSCSQIASQQATSTICGVSDFSLESAMHSTQQHIPSDCDLFLWLSQNPSHYCCQRSVQLIQ